MSVNCIKYTIIMSCLGSEIRPRSPVSSSHSERGEESDVTRCPWHCSASTDVGQEPLLTVQRPGGQPPPQLGSAESRAAGQETGDRTIIETTTLI